MGFLLGLVDTEDVKSTLFAFHGPAPKAEKTYENIRQEGRLRTICKRSPSVVLSLFLASPDADAVAQGKMA